MDLSKSHGISLDLAETHSALVLWQGDAFIESETIKLDNRRDMEDRLIFFLSSYHKQKIIKWVSAEAAPVNKNAKRIAEENKILGVIDHWCRQHNVKFFEGMTSQIDSACGIPHSRSKDRKGQSRKTFTRSVAERFISGYFNEDECDAICTGIWGWGKFKELMWSEEAT